jgi:peptidoglycan/xylan/chitin deacetylase (PgdA/CDA1 family)
MPTLSPEGIRSDIRDAEQAIRDIAGVDPRPWFRCPYGAGWNDPGVQGVLEELGYRHVGWDIILGDWEPGREPADIVDALEHRIGHCNGDAVVLLHTWPEQTLHALPAIIRSLRARSAQLVGIDELKRVPETVVF